MDFSEYVGIPFEPHGRTRKGLDCWGLVWLIYLERFKILLPSYAGHYDDTNDGVFLNLLTTSQRNAQPWIEVQEEQLGDVVLLRIFGCAMHVGLIIKPEYMINIRKTVDSCIEPIYRSAWKKRIEGIYRYDGPK